MEIYNAAWEKNWGFVPLTDAEIRGYAKELKPILDENWAMVAETKEGETVGVALTLPDYNQVLKKLNGRLLPFGWLTALRERKRIDAVRVFALGVKPEYQHTGVAAGLYARHYDMAASDPSEGRRDGLDPRDQRADEPRHGGDGRQDRQDATGSTGRICRRGGPWGGTPGTRPSAFSGGRSRGRHPTGLQRLMVI